MPRKKQESAPATPCQCKCHDGAQAVPQSGTFLPMGGEEPAKKERKPRKKSDKPPTEKRLAARDLFKRRLAVVTRLRAENPAMGKAEAWAKAKEEVAA